MTLKWHKKWHKNILQNSRSKLGSLYSEQRMLALTMHVETCH